MNTVAHNVVAKLSVAFVAVAMLFTMVSPAKAATAEEMQQMINQLLAQVAALQGTASTGGASTASICPYTWTRTLTVGATGMDVMKLQQFLNSDADTRVSASGVGSAGMETEYFGPATGAAVSKLQVKYRADILSPAGLVNPTGTFGPATMAKANALCVGGGTTTVPPVTGGDDDMDDDHSDDDMSSDELSGEADLDAVDISNGDDTDIEEGQEDAPVADIDVEFTDGDAMISRVDIALLGSGDEQDPWDTFETVTLWVDGEMVDEVDATDEDNYLDENDGSIRFSGLDIVAMEDDEVTITIGVTVQSSIDGASDDEDWEVAVGGIRYTDADDVTTTEDSVGDQEDLDGTYTNSASFTIGSEGGEDELVVKTSTEDPEATTLILEDDSKSDYMTVFAFDLDTDDSVNDIEITTVPVSVTVANDDFGDIVSDLQLVIDGQEYDDWSYASGTATTTGQVVVEFDIDGDLTIEAGERVGVELQVEFKALATEGATIQGSVTSVNASAIDAEGADDLDNTSPDQLTGSAAGDTHTLRTSGLIVDQASIETTTDTQGDNDTTGVFTIEFEVTAQEGDFYVAEFASTTAIAGTGTGGVGYTVEGPGTPASSGVLASTGDEDTNGVFTVREGETETFTLTVTIDASATGQHRVTIGELIFSENPNGVTSSEVQLLTPASDYRTAYENINAS